MEVNQNGILSTASHEKLAIAGMDVRLGGVRGLDDFTRLIYEGGCALGFNDSDFPAPDATCLAYFGVPENNGRTLPGEEKILLAAASNALLDAGIPCDEASRAKVAFLSARGSELAAFVSSQTEPPSSFHQFTGRFINLSTKGDPLGSGLIEAQNLLAAGEVETVVIASVSLAKDLVGLLPAGVWKNVENVKTPGFDQRSSVWTINEGAAAVVLTLEDTAIKRGMRVYAVIDSYARILKDLREPKPGILPTFVSADIIHQSIRWALSTAGVDPAGIGYLETLSSGFTPMDTAEITGLTRAYQAGKNGLTCAVGSLQSNAGFVFNATGVTALVRAALCLYHRMLPAASGWTEPKKAELWEGGPFYVCEATRGWFAPPGNPDGRLAALNSIGWDGSCTHLILGESRAVGTHHNHLLEDGSFYIIPVAGNGPQDMLKTLGFLKEKLLLENDPYACSFAGYGLFKQNENAEYALAVVGSDQDELLKDLDYMLKALSGAFEQKKSLQTPQGSCFSPEPVGRQGGVAFVYPGAFNSYIGLGRDLLLLFPGLNDRLNQLTSDPGSVAREHQLYPRSLKAITKETLDLLESELNDDPVAMITTGSLMAILFTMIMQDVFKIQPTAAFGYSLGEIAMLFGTGVWAEADATREKLAGSILFSSRLAGPMNAAREHWGIAPISENTSSQPIWANYFLMASPEKVAEAVANETHVYLTHINTPRQVVIGGDTQACQRVIAAVKCTSLKAPFDFSLHCEAIRSEYPLLADLHTWPVNAQPGIRLYSAIDNNPLEIESRNIADKISSMLISRLDFPTLVQQVYKDGARVFIELGANSNCSKWIDETLKGSPYVAGAINRRGTDDRTSIIRLLSRLVSHRVPLDLAPLFKTER
jgi:PfaB family protein